MPNEEVLGPRKTMFVIVIVVGCFAVLWPRILSPLILGHSRDQLKPNKFDRETGCCEVIFETEMAVLELINEVCSSAVQDSGKLSPYGAAECRKAVNETCGVDIAAFLKRSDNVGKTSKMLLDTMKSSNGSCLKEHFGVHIWSFSTHQPLSPWTLQDTVKQERPLIRGAGPHPALRERGRAIPPGTPSPARTVSTMPPHVRVRSSPLSGYYQLDVKPPPIPGMRPPLGSPGGPVPAPKSSMGFVMPIYTICIIVFFVYTLSKILFKRTDSPYEPLPPDPHFRRRVFRDDSRTSPDKLVVTAISGLVAEVQQQMEANYTQNQQRQEVQDNHTRPYTNGTVPHNSGPVNIVASEYQVASKEKNVVPENVEDSTPQVKEATPEPKEQSSEKKESTPEQKELAAEQKESNAEQKESEFIDHTPEKEITPEPQEHTPEQKELSPEFKEEETVADNLETEQENDINVEEDLIKLTENVVKEKNGDVLSKTVEDFIKEEAKFTEEIEKIEKQSTPELLEEAINEVQDKNGDEPENASVKVVGMELTAHSADGGAFPRAEPPATPLPTPRPPHEAEEVKSIFLEGEIPQQSRVLVTDFAENRTDRPAPTKHSPMVVSGKMTLSLIQDAPRETPERDPESTLDDFTTASALTQPAEKEDDLSDEEVEEEIEIEEIEEEIEVEEDELEEEEEEIEKDDKLKPRIDGPKGTE